MIKKCSANDINRIYEYIGDNYNKCLYLYLDFIKYGLNNTNVKMYIQENDNRIIGIALTYYSGMHIFSQNSELNIKEWIDLISDINPTMICGTKEIISKLENEIQNYCSEYGWVRELKCIDKKIDVKGVSKATMDDFMNIANLLFSDNDIGGSYRLDELYNQIVERNNEKYGRNYIIKEGNNIIAHAGTGAENNKVAMLNYVITSPEHRGKGLATKVTAKVCYDLINEGKKVYLINYTNESTGLYDKIGFRISCEWGKLFKNLKKEEEKK